MTQEATHKLSEINQRIVRAATMAKRDAGTVTLIAVSKTQAFERIIPLIAAGQRDFGENRVQEAQGKWLSLMEQYPDIRLHLVGQLQSNKADDAVGMAYAIHAVDRSSLVSALARAMDRTGKRPQCFIQVNLADEAQKGGCAVANLPALISEALSANLPLAGLMCVPPADLEPSPWFALLAKLAGDFGLAGLSMGMSGDFESAIKAGATHVRVGTALFGERT